MSNHTKEPWKVHLIDRATMIASDVESGYIVEARKVKRGDIDIANAHRIVTCVNACTNMKDPETEIAKLRADRAELLEALEELCKNSQGVFSTIERIIGDTDPYIDEDWTEEDVKTEEPLLWACQTLISIEQESKDLIKRMEAGE
jgi:hypothetical protein